MYVDVLAISYCSRKLCVVSFCFVEMGYINDDQVPCGSKDVKRNDYSLLTNFVPVNVFSESSVRRMVSKDVRSRGVDHNPRM